MRVLLATIGLTLAAAGARAQPYDLQWWTVDSGGVIGATGSPYVLDATIGQPEAGGPQLGGGYVLHTGFWAIASSGAIGPQADLSITLTNGTTTSVPGTAVTYTIVASNGGPAPVVGATVSDTPPVSLAGVTWTCTASPGSACPASGAGALSASVNLIAGGTATFALTGAIDPAATGTLANTAGVTSPNGVTDPALANNAATDTDTLVPSADLGMAVSDAPDPVAAGAPLTYTLEVTNTGPSASASMTVTDTLPPAVTFVGSTPGCTHASGVVTCALGPLAPGAQATVVLQVQVQPIATGTLSNSATVTGASADPAGANNTAVEGTQVSGIRADGEIAHGTRLRASLAANGGAAHQGLYRIRQQPYASYEVVVDATSGDIGAGQGPVLDLVAADGSSVLQSAQPVGAGPSRSLRFLNTTSAPVDSGFVRVRSASCGSDCGPDDVYDLRVRETTARIPRFNNSATQISVVLLQNRSSVPLQGRLYFWSTTGALLREEPIALGARGSLSVSTIAIGLGGQSGSISLAHDGPYDAVAGKAVALEPASGLAFDSWLLSIPR
jgi:uncharacterized repeat protein (TIGR01451 family)